LKVHETVHSSWFTVHSRKVNGEHAGEQERVPKTIKRAG
jgi:ribosomal protein S18